MKKKWIVFALVLMIALAMFMTACEDKNQPEESTDPQQEQTVDPGTDPSVNPNTDPTVKPDGDKKDEEKVDEKEDEEEEPYPEISKEDAEKKFKEQFTSFVNGENPIVNSVVNFINGIRYPDASRLLHRPKGNKEATIASLTYYFSESGISPYAIDRMLEDLQPLYDLFTVPAETPAETTTESTPANASGRSGAIESPVPSILAAKASVDLLLAPGNIDIVCDSINNFIKHLPVDGLLKLYGANLKGINDSRSYSSMYGDYTEQQFIEFFGENSAMVAALLDFDNCAAQKFAQKDCVKGTITDILGATKVVVTGNKAEVKNILTSASAALDYLADMDWAFLNEIPGLRNVTPVLSPGYIKYAIRMSYPYVLSKVLPDLSDVSLLNDLGKIVISVAEYLGTTDFDTDLQKTIAYHRAYSDYEFYDTDLTGLTTGIKAIGSVLKNATVDFIQINYRDVSAFLSVKKNKDATEEEEKAATDAICRVYVRASGLLYPIYAQLDDNIKAILEAKVAPLFAGAVDEDGKSVSITLASMLAALGTKPLYEDLSEEDVAKLTENDQDKYIHQEAAALYFSTTFENFRKEEEFRPGIKTPYEKMAFNYVLLPLNVTEKAIVTDALMKAMVTLEYYAEKDVVP
ncbi:MAG: hypothetical protein J5781_04495, partial [Clostridia bacterium]|nr:hypothetical protein [Clostridia bacterium]